MSTNLGNSMAMTRNLVLNNQKSTSYDVYLNYKGVNTTDSVFTKEPKSNTFLNTGRVVIGSKHIVAQRPEMDSDSVLLCHCVSGGLYDSITKPSNPPK